VKSTLYEGRLLRSLQASSEALKPLINCCYRGSTASVEATVRLLLLKPLFDCLARLASAEAADRSLLLEPDRFF